MINYLNLVALCVAILVLGILNLIFTTLDMVLVLVKNLIGRLPFHFAHCIIKMVDMELHSTQAKKHLKKNMVQKKSYWKKH